MDSSATLLDIVEYLERLSDEMDDCRYDHHGHCQAHFLQEADECCVKIARRVREGGKVDG